MRPLDHCQHWNFNIAEIMAVGIKKSTWLCHCDQASWHLPPTLHPLNCTIFLVFQSALIAMIFACGYIESTVMQGDKYMPGLEVSHSDKCSFQLNVYEIRKTLLSVFYLFEWKLFPASHLKFHSRNCWFWQGLDMETWAPRRLWTHFLNNQKCSGKFT